jgi:hypothetical protein
MSLQGTITPDVDRGIDSLSVTFANTIEEADRYIEVDSAVDRIIEVDSAVDRIIEID